MIRLQWIPTDKKRFLPLLLLADEQENMIDRYLMRGTLFAAMEGETPVGVAVVTKESAGIFELKNLAVLAQRQRQGIGQEIVRLISERYRAQGGGVLRVGTGESPKTLGFYRACGFTECGCIPNFFTDNYDHVMIEDGVTLKDMIYLEKKL